ncbi:outer membrane receptor protein involved in Fe transport [Larkinella arboricola]|uniref:Outer membrane receptor protein involved in Fe transport n=1 Tax=Larkinella arboricola TaxID=643671 RepID=A0A327WRU0_LARAB|nr:TonB-dependent receptor [Larkinella arboricola]RAJ94393.1 outer membrane receptor protein involved in Fe transport [Larkinella arboricola]
MKNLILFSIICCSTLSYAQQPPAGPPPGARPTPAIPGTVNPDAPRGNGKITGVLTDSTTNKPVEFATIALINVQTGKPVDGTTSDEKGKFSLTKLVPGEYRLQVSFLGYQNKETRVLKIERGTDINVGNVALSPDVKTLQEVNVVGQAQMIEEKVDRLVYNADKDVTNKGGDAAEVMRKVPMLSVDLDGNVSLRGSTNVRVLINNKPSTIVAASVSDALKQIPADMIKSVEVITSPSAKYDAEGSAGIINIITKKNTLQGLTLNMDAGVGNRGSNLGLNGNYRAGKMGFSLGGFGRANYNMKGKFENTQRSFFGDVTTETRQMADSRNQFLFGNYQLGFDYDIAKNQSLTASLRYGAQNGKSSQNLATAFFPGGLVSSETSRRDVDIKNLSGTVDLNVDYTRTFKKPQQELSILTQFSRNNRTNDYEAELFGNTAIITGRDRNDNLSYNQESTIQIDYQTPIKTNQQLEFGGKGIFRQVDSDYKYFVSTGPDGAYGQDPLRPNNGLDYNQNVAGTYVSYTYTSKSKYTVKAGTRYEYTVIDANFRSETPGQTIDIPSYGNLVPSINISKALKGGKTVKVAYNRRLQRPGIQFLNPNVNASNPQNITFGNPYLEPELTDNVELSSSVFIKKTYLNFSLFARRTDNSIESVRSTTQDGVITTTYQNIGHKENYGANVFGNITLLPKWQVGGGVDTYYSYITNNSPTASLNASNSGWVVTGRLFTNLSLKNGWGVQGFGFMQGRSVQLQGYQSGFGFYTLGVKKDFKDSKGQTKGSLGLAGENFLANRFKMQTQLTSPTFQQTNINYIYNRGVRLTFSYRIGKMSFDQPQRRKKSVNNDDVKDGGGQQGGENNRQR